MNHETLISTVAKGLTQIADALPRVELANNLYPSKRMEHAVSELYAYVIKFFIRAYDWYRESTFSHVLHSITRPAELRYKDLLDKITDRSRSIDQLAVSGSQAEQREMHKKLNAFVAEQNSMAALVSDLKKLIVCEFLVAFRVFL